jgi:hypothetical protein
MGIALSLDPNDGDAKQALLAIQKARAQQMP